MFVPSAVYVFWTIEVPRNNLRTNTVYSVCVTVYILTRNPGNREIYIYIYIFVYYILPYVTAPVDNLLLGGAFHILILVKQ